MEAALNAEPETERVDWRERGVRVDDVAAALARLNREHASHGHGHAALRSINLVVAPSPPAVEKRVVGRLDSLAPAAAGRAIVLRRHRPDRLDADATIICHVSSEPGRPGYCHDRVRLTANRARLEHADSLLAPLLVGGLPMVIWLPTPESAAVDAALRTADHLVLDTGEQGPYDALARSRRYLRLTRVHDLAWGRLTFWRALIATAFDPLERRSLLGRAEALEVRHRSGADWPALLLAGWIAARAGWQPEALACDGGDWKGTAIRGSGPPIRLALRPDPAARGCGGVEGVTFRAAEEALELRRGDATNGLRDVLVEALRPLVQPANGYGPAVESLAGALERQPR